MTSSANPYLAPSATSERTDSAEDIPSLRAIQTAHRGMIVGFMGQILNVVFMTGVVLVLPSLPGGQTLFALLSVVWIGAALVLTAMVFINVVRLAVALGWGGGVATLCLLAMFVGPLNLIVLLVAAGKAKARLRKAGLPIGFLGVRSDDFERWARRRGERGGLRGP